MGDGVPGLLGHFFCIVGQSAQRAAGERDAVRVVHEPIEDRVPKRGVADQLVPEFDRDLTRDERRASARSIFDDFQEIAAFAIAQGGQAPVLELCGAPHNSINGERAVM